MRYAAFFRNLNLGHRNCPDRRQFEQAFLDGGASTASSFLVNGSLVFDTDYPDDARHVLDRATQFLMQRCSTIEPVFVREVAALAGLVEAAPFGLAGPAAVYGCFVTFLHGDAAVDRLPPASLRGDVEVIGVTPTEALCIARRLGKSPGNPNAFIEKALSAPATTRAWNTVVRLVDKYA